MEVLYKWNLVSELTGSEKGYYLCGQLVFKEVNKQGSSVGSGTEKRVFIEIGEKFYKDQLKQYEDEDRYKIVCWCAIEYGLKKEVDKVVIGRPGKPNNIREVCFPEPEKIDNIEPNLCKIEIPDNKK